MIISVVCFNYRVKMQTQLCSEQRNRRLPHIPLASSPSVLAPQLPHLTSRLPLNNLTTASLFIYLSIPIFRAEGCRAFLPALSNPPFPLLRYRKTSSFTKQRWASLQRSPREARLQLALAGCPNGAAAASIALCALESKD